MEPNIGSLETLGEAIGVKEETLDLLEELTTQVLNLLALGPLQLILGPKISEMKPNLILKTLNPRNFYNKNQLLAEESPMDLNWMKLLHRLDLTNIQMFQLFQKTGIGETLVESTIYHGAEINTFHNIVDHVGLMDLLAQLLTELILLETELGQT